jgi:hypothetical protein
MIESIECLSDTLQPQMFRQGERSAYTHVQAEEIKPYSGIASDHRSGEPFGAGVGPSQTVSSRARALCRLLFRLSTGGDIEGRSRVVLQNSAQAPAMGKVFRDATRRRCG